MSQDAPLLGWCSRRPRWTCGLAALPLVMCCAGLMLLAAFDEVPFDEALIFSRVREHAALEAHDLVSLVVVICGFVTLHFIVGALAMLHVPFARRDAGRFVGLSFVSSWGLMVLTATVVKVVHGPLTRTALLVAMAILVAVGAAAWIVRSSRFATQVASGVAAQDVAPYLGLLVVGVVTMVWFGPPIPGVFLDYDFSEARLLSLPLGAMPDIEETYGHAASLQSRLLPWWDLEYGDRFGFVFTLPPGYSMLASLQITLFGRNYPALMLPSVLFSITSFMLVLGLVGRRSPLRWFVCAQVLVIQIVALRGNAELWAYPDPFFAFLLLCLWLYLWRDDLVMAMVFAVMLSFTRFQGPIFVGATWVSAMIFMTHRRRTLVGWAVLYAALFAVETLGVLGVSAWAGHLDETLTAIAIEQLGRFDFTGAIARTYPDMVIKPPEGADPRRIRWLLGRLLSTTAGTAVILPVFGRDRRDNMLAVAGLIYLLGVLLSSHHVERYVLPLVTLSAMLVSLRLERWLRARQGVFSA